MYMSDITVTLASSNRVLVNKKGRQVKYKVRRNGLIFFIFLKKMNIYSQKKGCH